MKKLGFGLMRLPQIDGELDYEQIERMVDAFLDKGFTYFDTAWMYCGFRSEQTAKRVLVDRHPRDSFTLATKLHFSFFQTPQDREELFRSQLEKTGAGYFDYYLLHGISAGSIEKYESMDCFGWLREKKAQGLVRKIGFSYHDNAQLLDEILTRHPETEFVQLQINYLDWESPWVQSRACYEVARKHGKEIVVMEPVKGGTLANIPKPVEEMLKAACPELSTASWAIRFAASLEGVMVVLSGMSNMEQIEDNLSYMSDFKPLSGEETALVHRAAAEISKKIAIPCTGCAYCTDGCPQNIPIPQYFSLYNADKQETAEKWTPTGTHYEYLTRTQGKASSCIACGQCESVCPQHLEIIRLLRDVAAHFE